MKSIFKFKELFLLLLVNISMVTSAYSNGYMYFVRSPDDPSEYLLRSNEGFIRFTPSGITHQKIEVRDYIEDPILGGRKKYPQSFNVYNVFVQFIGSANVSPVGVEETSGVTNYLIGSDNSKWKREMKHFSKLVYPDLYSGVDLFYYIEGDKLKYDFVIKAGSDLKKISWRYLGIDSLKRSQEGRELLVYSRAGVLSDYIPVSFGINGGDSIPVQSSFEVKDNSVTINVDDNFGFEKLVIDPVLNFSTFIGGSNDDFQYTGGLSRDGAGNIYETGRTLSANFPTTPGVIQSVFGGSMDVVVYKLNPSGSNLIYSTYIGGGNLDAGYSTFADPITGEVYVGGTTGSASFPITAGAFQAVYGGGVYDGFVVKLDSMGGNFIYSTFIGNNQNDLGAGLTVGSTGNALLVGQTNGSFLIAGNGYQTVYGGGPWDAFVAELNSSGSSLIRTTLFGGFGDDHSHSIQIDPLGNIVIMGFTTGFITTTPGCYDNSYNGGDWDIYVARFNNQLSGLISSTYVGGNGTDMSWNGLVLDSLGNAVVAGYTESSNFPVTIGAFQTSKGVGFDAFLFKINTMATQMLASTFFGNIGNDEAWGVALTTSDEPVLVGFHGPNLHYTPCTFDSTLSGSSDAFLCHMNSDFSSVLFSTYLGGSGTDHAYNVLMNGQKYLVAGSTRSASFPVVQGSYDVTFNGAEDFFVLELERLQAGIATASFSVADTVCVGQPLFFINNSINSSNYLWNFGDGGQSGAISPSHIYQQAGYYTITLVVTGTACFLGDTVTDSVFVLPAPLAQFSHAVFCDRSSEFISTGNAGWNSWDMGDGNIYMGDTVTHVFDSAGTFNVTLVSSNGFCTDTASFLVTVPMQSNAVFSVPDTICGFAVSFDGQQSLATTFYWDFGDGNYSGDSLVVHNYASEGLYSITLITDSSGCADTLSADLYVVALPEVVGTVSGGCDLTVEPFFQLLNTDSILFSIGDGTVFNSIPVDYQFSVPGLYNYQIIVFNDLVCTDTLIGSVSVDVTPVASITVDDTLCSGDITFLTSSMASSFQWSINNVPFSTSPNPILSVPDSGSYILQLVVSNGSCSDTAVTDIWIANQPLAQYSILQNCDLTLWTIYSGLPHPDQDFTWIFGDGSLAFGDSVFHVYQYSDTFNLSLVVTNSSGCADTVTNQLYVSDPERMQIAYSLDTCSSLVRVIVDNFETPAFVDFGDGFIRELQNGTVEHYYQGLGIYSVMIVSSAGSVCADTAGFVLDLMKIELLNSSVPNVFSPNGDGVNDWFYIPKSVGCLSFSIKIFNRWGQVVYESTNPLFKWDGKSRGIDLPEGVYMYLLKGDIEKNGTITIMR